MIDESLRTKSVQMPQWLIDTVSDYQKKHDLESWSTALLILVACGADEQTKDNPSGYGYLGGSKEVDSAIMQEWESAEAKSGFRMAFWEYLHQKFSKRWGKALYRK